MKIWVLENKEEAGKAAAMKAAELLRDAIVSKGRAVFVAATGTSQIEFLEALTKMPGIDWARTTMYHLDEYLGIPENHPASFRRYLMERLIAKVKPGAVHLINGDAADPEQECQRLSRLIENEVVDVAFVGIGENGHLAFNDPPANFDTTSPFIVVELAESARAQQVNEGWFSSLDEVPRKAITMTIPQILKARHIICTVPEARKAKAVKECLEGEVTPMHPASVLQGHPSVFVFLDKDSAKLLDKRKLKSLKRQSS